MIVVKVGGSEGIDLGAVCRDIAFLVKEGKPLVFVHGGSHQTNVLAKRLGHPPQFVTSVSGFTSRRTDPETLRIFIMACCSINKQIVEQLQAEGVNALGLSGIDGRLLEGRRKSVLKIVEQGRRRLLRDDFTGTVETVNASLLNLLLNNGYLPVVVPPAISTNNEAINVDGDRAAVQIAVALGADCLVILSNVPGLLRSFPDESTLIERIPHASLQEVMQYAKGRMRTKMMWAQEAIERGVAKVIFGDGRIESPVHQALAGKGTIISR